MHPMQSVMLRKQFCLLLAAAPAGKDVSGVDGKWMLLADPPQPARSHLTTVSAHHKAWVTLTRTTVPSHLHHFVQVLTLSLILFSLCALFVSPLSHTSVVVAWNVVVEVATPAHHNNILIFCSQINCYVRAAFKAGQCNPCRPVHPSFLSSVTKLNIEISMPA